MNEDLIDSLQMAIGICGTHEENAQSETDKAYWRGAKNAYSLTVRAVQRELKNLHQPVVVVSGQQECYKTGAPCKYGCEGLCKDSC